MATYGVSGLLLRNFLLVAFAHLIFLTPVFYFGDGFFLRRVEFPNKSTAHGKPIYKRAVILLVDALSFSFVQNHDGFSGIHDSDTVNHFANKLTVFNELLDPKGSLYTDHGKLYKFLADPPTTTMQRIKALSTGSLSTFIEIAANFFSSEIAEDSWIYQSKAVGEGVVALGDDTWGGLFPSDFKRSHLLPSFNVKDLDTVDNGVLEHLYSELEARDWSVLLAHFLGVDHCGHTFGRNHPEMTRKLKQMDTVIRKVLDYIDNETVLFVLGDHGMTPTGDHGGDSDLEVSAALFVYAPKHTFNPAGTVQDEIFQTDFIPTISTLLGWPIPFSSIGSIMDDLFIGQEVLSRQELLQVYQMNSLQLVTYFDQYFSDKKGAAARLQIDSLFAQASNFTDKALGCVESAGQNCKTVIKDAVDSHNLLHKTIRSSCEAAWIKFNLVLVFGGLLGSAFGICVLMLAVSQSDTVSLGKLVFGLILVSLPLGSIVAKVLFHLDALGSDLASILLLNGALLAELFLFVRGSALPRLDRLKKYSDFAIFLAPLLIGKFSNSFVIQEPYIILFILAMFVLIRAWRLLGQILMAMQGKMWRNLVAWPLNLHVFITWMLLTDLRIQLGFLSCREEHGPNCEQTSLLSPLPSLILDETGSSYLTIRMLFSCLAILSVPFYFRYLAKKRGNLDGYNLSAHSYSPGLFVIAFLIILDWLLQAATLKHGSRLNLPTSVLCLLPKCVYFLIAFLNVVLWAWPLIFVQKSEQDLVAERFEGSQVDPTNPVVVKTLFNFLRTKYESGRDAEISSLFVYGLGSVISCAWQLFYTSMFLLVAMLLGDGLVPAVCFVVLCLWLFYKTEMSIGSIGLMLHLVQNLAFYVTGHHATWTHIKWQAAFVGFDQVPDFFAIPGALILTNTFAGNVLTVLAIPFFILWPVVEMNSLPVHKPSESEAKKRSGDETEQSECGFIRQPQILANALSRVCLLFIISTSAEIFFSAIAACFLRRHLMAYKIFVPRLIFTILSFGYNFILLLAVATLPVYVLLRLTFWRRNVDRKEI